MEKNTGINRLYYATLFSWQGLKLAIKHEPAFRQECLLACILVPLSFYLDVSAYERLAMILSIAFLMVTELINSAIECVVDRISSEYHELSGRAKDYGSIFVFIALLMLIAVWVTILIH